MTNPDDEFDDVNSDSEGEARTEPEVTIEISGLSLFTHVGVSAAEREVGQRLLLAVDLFDERLGLNGGAQQGLQNGQQVFGFSEGEGARHIDVPTFQRGPNTRPMALVNTTAVRAQIGPIARNPP